MIRWCTSASGLMVAVVVALATPAQAQNAGELGLRIDRLEAQLRTLTGLVEELTFRVQDLEQLVVILRADNEALYQLLGNAGGAVLAPAGQPLAPIAANAEPVDPQPNAGGPLDLAGALRPDGGFNIGRGNVGDGPVAAAAPAAPPLADQPVAALTGNADADYNAAYQFVLTGDYELAEAAFRAFLASYPGHSLAVDARFWMAEAMFSREMYLEAANEFYSAYSDNPGHDKAPDMLLKLGISLAQLGQVEAACGTFEQVLQQYPNASNALLQRLAAEQANARC